MTDILLCQVRLNTERNGINMIKRAVGSKMRGKEGRKEDGGEEGGGGGEEEAEGEEDEELYVNNDVVG